MSDTPKMWLIEHEGLYYPEAGCADALSMVRRWAERYPKRAGVVRISEVLPGHDVILRMRAEAEYK